MSIECIAREMAESSIVLLKNDHDVLPLKPGTKVAFLGRTQLQTLLSGNGSGAARTDRPCSILEACEAAGLLPVSALSAAYRALIDAEPKAEQGDIAKLAEMVHSGLIYEFFGQYHAPSPEYVLAQELISAAAQETDTAILTIGRNAGGEECDRHPDDDFALTQAEEQLLAQADAAFDKVIVLLNTNGLIDMSWLERFPHVCSVLFVGLPGEEGPAALARLITGQATPSGKLAVTIARSYDDYPAARHFTWNKENGILTYADYGLDAEANGSAGFAISPVTVYAEDLYAGYRCFDTFGKQPLFPFGFGLSYTTFSISQLRAALRDGVITVSAELANTGSCDGRETLQLYVSATGTALPHPLRELKGFAKTPVLAAGESCRVEMAVPAHELAAYDEASASWVVQKGRYMLLAGTSSRDVQTIGCVTVPDDLTVQSCRNRLVMNPDNREKIDLLCADPLPMADPQGTELLLTALPGPEQSASAQLPDCTRFTSEELAALCVGYGPGTPFAALRGGTDPSTLFDESGAPLTENTHPTGVAGYVSPAIPAKGLRSVYYKDGPAGVGGVAWPCQMLVACSFDRDLLRRMGEAVAQECRERHVEVWLAPAVNLHRHPLGGRNFEYYSEDPFLSGACAVALAQGVQAQGDVIVCPKHFAVNEQETYRRGSSRKSIDAVDSILTERAARELYLKPFEMLVRQADLACIMTSFNKINGVFAGGSADLCTGILRDEWGFTGAVVTDWGDMDIVVDGADAVAAGNDIVMPGGPPVIRQILDGLKAGRVTREQMETAVAHLIQMLHRLHAAD